jgi:hypothetical protein
VAGGPVLTVGIPASITHSRSVSFEDSAEAPDPLVFRGSARFSYASWAMGFGGASYQWIQLGDAEAFGGGFQFGWDASIAGGAGISTVISTERMACVCESP